MRGRPLALLLYARAARLSHLEFRADLKVIAGERRSKRLPARTAHVWISLSVFAGRPEQGSLSATFRRSADSDAFWIRHGCLTGLLGALTVAALMKPSLAACRSGSPSATSGLSKPTSTARQPERGRDSHLQSLPSREPSGLKRHNPQEPHLKDFLP
jgi:hypothetical protein